MKKKTKVILVDDEPHYLEAMSIWLGSQGFEVNTATSEIEAPDKMWKETPQVVFLDLRMPEMDGFETLRRIRAKDKKIQNIVIR